jgi:UDP-N-acetylglucosamine acyltransferase
MNKIHPTAIIEEGAKIGINNIISENVIIRKNVKVGDNNIIGPSCLFQNNLDIGDNNKFYGFISIGSLGEMGLKGDSIRKNGKIIIGSDNIFREFITVNFPVKEKNYIYTK